MPVALVVAGWPEEGFEDALLLELHATNDEKRAANKIALEK